MENGSNIAKIMDNCNSWILPQGTIIHYQGIPYYLSENTEILGNTMPIKVSKSSLSDLENFLDS
ncbi:hypothetical protein CH372_19905 [Leptospira meyeri]|nr:hypothetical protein CH372_19905 [Leptospira meyeri]